MTAPVEPVPSPPEIPGYWEADVVLADGGTVHMRPRHDDDHDAIVRRVHFHHDLYHRIRAVRALALR